MKKVILLTGAAGGLGLEIIRKLAQREGETRTIVACAHRRSEQFEKTLQEIEVVYNTEIVPLYTELTSEKSIVEMLDDLHAKEMIVEVLINNAGIAHGGFFQTTSVDIIRNVFDVNFISHVFLTNLLLEDMRRNDYGVIANVASIAGQDLAQGNSAYGASKATMISWTKILAEKYRKDRIYAFAVAPGLANTVMAGRMEEKALHNMVASSAMQRLAKPDEIADVIVEGIVQAPILCGQVIRIDGGDNRG